MTDAETRAELERIGFAGLWDQASNIKATLYAKNGSTMSFHHSIEKALRLLAESQRALREIGGEQPSIWASSKPDPVVMTCPKCEQLIKIAKTAIKEE